MGDPFDPAGRAPPMVVPLPALQAPVWGQQAGEGPAEYAAFLAWLCGGRELRDAHAAVQASGLTPEQVRAVSGRWVWEIRAREWLAHTRAAQREAAEPLREAIHAVMARRLDAVRDLVEVVAREAAKAIETSKGTPAPTLEPRTLARFMAVSTPVLESLRRQAEGLPAEIAGENGPDYSALTAEELEQYRRLRAKARTG
jgi:hypothetical protein